MQDEEARAIADLRRADAAVEVGLGEVAVSLPAPGYSRLKGTVPWLAVALGLAASGLIVGASPPELISLWLFLLLPASALLWLAQSRARAFLLARRRVSVQLNDRTVRFEDQEMPLEELYAVITGDSSLRLERKGSRDVVVEIPLDPIAQPAMQSLLYAMAHRRQAVARQEGHDSLKAASRPPAELDALRGRR